MNHIPDPQTILERRARLQGGGRLVIPADCRKALGLAVGEEMIIRLIDDEIHIYPARQALMRARKLARKYSRGKSMVDELIAERRREARRE